MTQDQDLEARDHSEKRHSRRRVTYCPSLFTTGLHSLRYVVSSLLFYQQSDMSLAENPRKRPRTEVTDAREATAEPPVAPAERDKEFWFDDGTVILIVSGVEFRVYKGTMVEHSTVFADMFSLPQPAAAPNGAPCPIVHLNDSPHAWRHVLRVLFPRKGVRYVCRAPRSLFMRRLL